MNLVFSNDIDKEKAFWIILEIVRMKQSATRATIYKYTSKPKRQYVDEILETLQSLGLVKQVRKTMSQNENRVYPTMHFEWVNVYDKLTDCYNR